MDVKYAQLEEGVRDLKHQDVGVVVFMAHQYPLTGAPHAVAFIVLSETFEPGNH